MISKAGLIFASTFLAFAKACNSNSLDPNNPRNYVSKETIAIMAASQPRISTDLSEVTFILVTPEKGVAKPFVFNAGTKKKRLLKKGFDPKRDTKFISHGWTGSGMEYAQKFAKGKKMTQETTLVILFVGL